MEAEVALVGGRLIDGTGREPLANAGLLFRDGVIVQVGSTDRLRLDPDVRVIDVEGRTIMPGLIDCHTHLTYHLSQPDVWQLERNESVELNTLHAASNARAILNMGFTTIGDGGCRGFIGPAVRDGVALGLVAGPLVVAAGAIICGTAGLLDATPPWMRIEGETALGETVDGVDAIRRAVRRQVKGGVDWIKVATSGVAGSRWATAETDDLGLDEVRAAVAEAAKFGRPVHAHAHSNNGIRAAVLGGAISLHSGEFADDETLALARDRGVVVAATIAWLHARCLPGSAAAEDPEFLDQAWRAFAAARDMLPRARALGAKIAIGTDAAHRFPHVPDGVLEMEYLQALGFPPLEVIRAATQTAAEAVGMGDRVGTLEPGKRADILVVAGDPAEDVTLLRDKRAIWRMYRGGAPVALPADRGATGPGFRAADWIGLGLAETRTRSLDLSEAGAVADGRSFRRGPRPPSLPCRP